MTQMMLSHSYNQCAMCTHDVEMRREVDGHGPFSYAPTSTSFYPFTRLLQGEHNIDNGALDYMSPILGIYANVSEVICALSGLRSTSKVWDW